MNFEMPEENTASILVAKKVSRPNLQFKVLPKIMQAFTLIVQGYSVAKACRECRVSKRTFYSKLAGSEMLRDMYLQAQSLKAQNKALWRAKQRAGLLE